MLLVVCGLYVMVVTPFLPAAPDAHPRVLLSLAAVAAAIGLAFWLVPWDRWPRWATLLPVPVSLTLIAAHGWLIGADGYRFGPLFMVVFAWIGNTQPRGSSVAMSPLLVVAYGVPALFGPQHAALAIGGAIYTIPICLLLGETVAWVSYQNRRAVRAEHQTAEFLRAAFDNASIGSVAIDLDGRIIQANRVLEQVLGYGQGELLGLEILDLVHADDQQSCRVHGRRLLSGAATTMRAERRFHRRDGSLIWVDLSASMTVDQAGQPTSMVAQIQDVTERRAYESNLTYQALHDDLTGLPNRVLLLDRVRGALARAGDQPVSVALLYLDLDNFKYVNDSHGHAAGDALLVDIAQRLSSVIREGDTLVRLGGDEFVIFCDEVHDGQVDALSGRIHGALTSGFELAGSRFVATVSIGIVVIPATDASADVLLRDADTALYEAKRRGRARSQLFTPELKARTTSRVQTETDLRGALIRHELQLWYQPEVELATGDTVGAEALLRWDRGAQGIALPGDFIDIAEETGLIVTIGEWAVREACHAAARWLAAGSRLRISVNLSSRQLSSPGLVSSVRDALAASRLPSSLLCLEVTESVLIDDAEAALGVLRELKACGVKLALDDFGTGYSSMSYLRQYPFDALKIDRSFISDLDATTEDTALVTAIVDMAEALGLETVAEGVERADQLEVVTALGCTLAQGFLLDRPMPEDQFARRYAPVRTAGPSTVDVPTRAVLA
ncbi:MAG: diguanylate cyclase/phosphodiesterase & domain with sensor(s) [Acidimicrobiales bacterium]|nr:diguanylate cyclase/phosphodiesterase & domain with sensor(s) [Acidimicrobiales bacterium]